MPVFLFFWRERQFFEKSSPFSRTMVRRVWCGMLRRHVQCAVCALLSRSIVFERRVRDGTPVAWRVGRFVLSVKASHFSRTRVSVMHQRGVQPASCALLSRSLVFERRVCDDTPVAWLVSRFVLSVKASHFTHHDQGLRHASGRSSARGVCASEPITCLRT